MGTVTLATKNPGDIISSSDPNQYKTALGADHVPRNVSGVPTDLGGGLGSTLYRWASSYIKRIYLGTAAEEVWIDGTGTVFRVGIGTVTKMQCGTAGLDGSLSVAAGTWLLSMFRSTERPVMRCATFASSGNFTTPTDGTNIIIWAAGGGGGGGGGGGATGSQAGGGGGGAGAEPELCVVQNLVAGSVYAVSIGAGGTAGTAGGGTQTGGAGGQGGSTTFGNVLAIFPGAPGGQGGAGGASGAGGSAGGFTLTGRIPGGAGSTSGSGAGNGTRSKFAAGGNGNGGGGGGAGIGVGANGGVNGNPGGSLTDGTAAGANTSAGGGGGGGGTNSNQQGAAGGAGGSGILYIFWWGKQT